MRIAKSVLLLPFATIGKRKCPSGMSAPGMVAVKGNIVKAISGLVSGGRETPSPSLRDTSPKGRGKPPTKNRVVKDVAPYILNIFGGEYFPHHARSRAQLRIANSSLCILFCNKQKSNPISSDCSFYTIYVLYIFLCGERLSGLFLFPAILHFALCTLHF